MIIDLFIKPVPMRVSRRLRGTGVRDATARKTLGKIFVPDEPQPYGAGVSRKGARWS